MKFQKIHSTPKSIEETAQHMKTTEVIIFIDCGAILGITENNDFFYMSEDVNDVYEDLDQLLIDYDLLNEAFCIRDKANLLIKY